MEAKVIKIKTMDALEVKTEDKKVFESEMVKGLVVEPEDEVKI